MSRKVKTYLGLVSFGLILQSCSINGDQEVGHTASSDNSIVGSYIYGNEVNSLQPCGSDKELWVIGSKAVMTSLEEEYLKLASKPYQAVYVRFEGKQLARADDGFAADYSGRFKVTDVVTLQKDSICP